MLNSSRNPGAQFRHAGVEPPNARGRQARYEPCCEPGSLECALLSTTAMYPSYRSIFEALIVSALLALPGQARAQIEPLTAPDQLWGARPEPFVQVAPQIPDSVRVLIADYDLIRRDFLQTSKMSEAQIDSWLIANSSFIAKNQANQQVVTTKIPTTGKTRTAYRPYEYHRGTVFVADGGGLLDAIGTGAVDPAKKSHRTGTATMPELLRKYFFEKLVNTLLRTSGSKFTTVASYAVIDYGFMTWDPSTQTFVRAAYLLRQGHRRSDSDEPPQSALTKKRGSGLFMPEAVATELERELRQFGITSAGANRRHGYDVVNLQGTPNGALVDTDALLVLERFDREVRSSDGQKIIWRAGESPQPNAEFKILVDLWGPADAGYDSLNEITDKVERALHNFVDRFIHNEASKADVSALLNQLIQPARHRAGRVFNRCYAAALP